MAGTPADHRSGAEELIAAYGAGLHRLAAALTGDTAAATRLVALTLSRASSPTREARLREDLVRHFLRSRPRRNRDTVPVTARDAGDVLRALPARARAALALRVVAAASDAEIGRAVRRPPEKVARLIPSEPGVEVAIAAVADQHALTGARLHDELMPELAAAPSPSRASAGGRRWWWAAAAAALVLVLGWYAVSTGQDDEPTAEQVSIGEGPAGVDLTDAGWELRPDGDPPNNPMGLRLVESAQLDAGAPTELDLSRTDAAATFAVLWCDMPPAEDANLQRPEASAAVDGRQITLPCAGREGRPAVTASHIVTLPPRGTAEIEVTGDLPPQGEAVVGLYIERENAVRTPLPQGSRLDAPVVPDDAVLIEQEAPALDMFFQGERLIGAATLSATSTIRVWAGRTGAVTVLVDGVPVTDDGDVAAPWGGGNPAWEDQHPDVRQGQWLVYGPGSERTFAIPESVLPEAGQQRTSVVEVFADGNRDHLQIAVTDAAPSPVDTAAVAAVGADAVEVPELVVGRRLAGAWELPQDGHLRELESAREVGSDVIWVLLMAPTDTWAPFWSEGLMGRGERLVPVWGVPDGATLAEALRQPWNDGTPPGDEPLVASAPATSGQPSAVLVAYEKVPYEDFDFAAAEVPDDSWPAGTSPPPTDPFRDTGPFDETIEVVGPDDLDDEGRVTVDLPPGEVGARITTEGIGRIRFLVDGQPADQLWATNGWWSSWTDQAVTSRTYLSYAQYPAPDELTIWVEDYEEFEIEVLHR